MLELLSVLSPFIVIVLCWKQRFTLLWLYAATGFCADILSYWVEPKQIVGNLFLLSEFIFLSFFFRRHVFKNQYAFYLVTILIGLSYIAKLFWSPLNKFQLLSAGLFCSVYIIYSLITFYQALKKETFNNTPTTFTWAVTAIIYVYASGCCLLFLFAGLYDIQFIASIWITFFFGINIFRYTMIGIALYRKPVHGA